jgi:dolichyl-phosphate-mannose-protein mannosyltransferase
VVSLALTAIVAVAVTFRVTSLATYGLSDDEVTKVRATEGYSRGDFSVNAEHPMLMKLAIWSSLGVAGRWNQAVPAAYQIPVEAAVRLPNALAGAASVLVMYGVANAYFGTPVALIAALLLALDPAVTAINRLAKEDTFVVFFFLLAVWLYERGKQVGARNTVQAQPWYLGSAAGFGLMVASKYLPHFYGLYCLTNVATLRDAGPNSPNKRRFFATIGVAFIIANFAVVFPSTWGHMLSYVQGSGMSHHGWPYAHRLWVTDVPISTLGIPPTFYLMLLLTRLPLVTLAGAAVGAAIAWSRRERGYVFLRVFFIFQLIGYSAMAAKFLRYSLPILVVVDLIAAVGIVASVTWLLTRAKSEVRTVLVPIAYGALAVVLFAGQAQASPFFSMHRTTLARWLDPDGRRFPESSYDFGVREAVSRIAASARPGAEIVSDVPQVVAFYLSRGPRRDLQVKSLSGSGVFSNTTEQWVLVQESHVYFETEELIALLRLRHAPVAEFRMDDVRVLQLFRIEKDRL